MRRFTAGWRRYRAVEFASIAALSSLALLAQAVERIPIVYGAPDKSVWTARVDDHGIPDNPLVRAAGPMFEKIGIPWRAEIYPASRLFQYLKEGRIQFSMLVKAPPLTECCLFSRRPVAAAEIRVYRHPSAAPIKRREDLRGKQLITLRGYSYGGLAQYIAKQAGDIVNHSAPGHEAAFRMLAAGRADYVIDYAGPAREVMADAGLTDYVSDVLSRQDVFLVLSKTYPDAETVMAELEAVAASSEIARLFPR